MKPTSTVSSNVHIRHTLREEVLTNPLKCMPGVESHNIFCVLFCLVLNPGSNLSPVRFLAHFQAVIAEVKRGQLLAYLYTSGPEDPRVKELTQYFLRLEVSPPRHYDHHLLTRVAEFVAGDNQAFVAEVGNLFSLSSV